MAMGTRMVLPLRSPASFVTDDRRAAQLTAVRHLVRDAIPALADFSLFYVAHASTIRCVAAAHATPTGARVVRALAREYHLRRSDRGSTVAAVIRTGRPIVRKDIAVELEATGSSHSERDTVANLHRRLAARCALVVPVRSDRSVIGALTLCYSQSERSYSARDIRAAMRLAARIARVLTGDQSVDATVRLRAAARDARQGTTLRRRVAARN
jgi:GAF domain-containing protein